MLFQWLKRYMPRGLYGRAALILILPVVTLQLVVSVVFIQRHFEGVSRQMSREVARDVNLVLNTLATPQSEAIRQQLAVDVTAAEPGAVPAQDQRRWYDFSGIVVTRTLQRDLPGLRRVLLPDDTDVILFVERDGLWQVRFARRRVSASNPHQLLVNMVVFGGLMTAVAFIYLRNQLRPITRLADAAEAFGRGRHEPYSPAGAVEVRAAGHAFLDMRARIERQIEQRTLMLSGVSHDMRTPLTRLRLGLSMLDDADSAGLERDVDDLQRLLDAFLDFARGNAEAGEPESTDPVALVAEIVSDAQRGGAQVRFDPPPATAQMMLRPMALRRAVENLIGNAVRYGTQAEVSVQITDKSLRIRVEDDGPGIPEAQREEALRPFVRLDPARNQDKGSGVGLGLAIAADIARGHGGVLRLGKADLGGLRADIVIAR
ncbi:ATP-binding protein [Thalassococcus sp. BH17M4-6]|uniref:ATP-binding protein n=1 Tax=Thalassococcus sp. BH17M4-6 TaxID=3413148 RepID=UPI003BEC28D0